MRVIKRDGKPQDIDFEKIHWRLKAVCSLPKCLEFQKLERPDAYETYSNLPPILHADVDAITKKTIDGLYNNISTTEIDKLSAEIAQERCTIHPDNSVLACRILISNMQKNISEIMFKRFSETDPHEIKTNLFKYVMKTLYFNLDSHHENYPLVSPYLAAIADKYIDRINKIIDYSRDFTNHDYLGIKTLEKVYLFSVHEMDGFTEKNITIESPSMSDMRIAIALVCAPSPCPTYYEDIPIFIKLHPEVVKYKYRDSENITTHTDKRIHSKLFKKLYWEYQLEKEKDRIEISEEEWVKIKDIYDGMTTGKFTPATPTRFASGTLRPQGSSCFLIAMADDSLKGIYETLQEQSQIAKHAGGVGIWMHNIRSVGSYIAGTNGKSNGLKPMLKVFNASSRYVDQGGKRDGNLVVYLEPWHADIVDFVKLKRKKGTDSDRAKDLFYALWIPDEFFRCMKEKKDWYLFDPAICPKLYNSYDEHFSSVYLSDDYIKNHKKDFLFTYRYRKYITQGKYVSKISIDSLLEEIVETVRDTGVPYFLSKDACNRKSNQKNLGVIKSSNLCAEIIQYSDSNETSVCNLSSVCLNKFLRPYRPEDNIEFRYNVALNDGEEKFMTFDFEEFGKIVRLVQSNIDKIIDTNFYPTVKSKNSNLKHRNCALGIQGEADMFAMLRLPWNSKEAHKLRFYIMEKMYYECIKSSIELSKKYGPYDSFQGSPASMGKLQFDLWKDEGKKISFQLSLDWISLKEEIQQYGLRNSLLIALMPTASTSAIMGNSPSIEPFNSLVYIKKNGTGAITVINKNLVDDLMSLNLWNKSLSDKILSNHGSIQNILEIPKKLRDSYLTVYDLEPEDITDASFVRGWFVDQSQSMNLFFKNITLSNLTKAWTRGWIRGLKTLSYYCRTRPSITAQKAQIENVIVEETINSELICFKDNLDCLSCGS